MVRRSLVLTPIFVLMCQFLGLGQAVSLGTATSELEAALRGKGSDKRLAAISKFAKCGDAGAVKVLFDQTQKTSRRLTKLRDDYEKLGKRINDETIKLLDERATKDNKISQSAAAQADKVLKPLKEEFETLAKTISEEEELREALIRGVSETVKAVPDAARAAAVQNAVDSFGKSLIVPDRIDALAALGFVNDPAADVVLSSASKLGDVPAVRVAALEAMLRRPENAAFEKPAIEGMKDEAWQVRSAALAVLRAVGSGECMPALIEALGKSEGRLLDEVAASLKSLAKVDFHDNAVLWKEWWDQNRGSFEGRGANAGVKAVAEAKKDGGSKDEGKGTYFYGIRTRSKRPIFVLDVSGSMNYALDDPAKGMSTPAPNGKRRIDSLVKELLSAIAAMEDDAMFNIIFFHSEVAVWQKKMVKATKENKAAARAWTEKIQAVGGTNIFDALEKAFSIAGRGTFDKNYGAGADTILFMSDGVANHGRITAPEEILKEVKRLNDLQRIQIHCVALSVGADDALMKKLAEQNGGQFVHITK